MTGDLEFLDSPLPTALQGLGPPAASSVLAAGDTPARIVLVGLRPLVHGVLDPTVLDPEERARAERFVHPADRMRYETAHVVLRLVLADALGSPPARIGFTREACPLCGGPHGRPAVIDPSDAVQFSLSHSGDMVLVGVAPGPIGVDIEALTEASVVDDLLPLLHPREQADISATRPERRRAAFAQLWARKEAYLKGLGTGLGRQLAADDLSGGRREVGHGGWQIAEVSVPTGYAAACAVTVPSRS